MNRLVAYSPLQYRTSHSRGVGPYQAFPETLSGAVPRGLLLRAEQDRLGRKGEEEEERRSGGCEEE
eukprot:3656600-Rhodomonas_salina.1